jgi:hypothetical protein
MAWMPAETDVAVTAGVLASSIAVTRFGLDPVIEIFAAARPRWRSGLLAAGPARSRLVNR